MHILKRIAYKRIILMIFLNISTGYYKTIDLIML